MPKTFYTGIKFKVVFTDRAVKAFEKLSRDIRPVGLLENLVALIKKFADTGQLHSPEQLNCEGDGFYAIKSRGAQLRSYFWYCNKNKSVIVVSHLIKKTRKKLDPADKTIMQKERDKY